MNRLRAGARHPRFSVNRRKLGDRDRRFSVNRRRLGARRQRFSVNRGRPGARRQRFSVNRQGLWDRRWGFSVNRWRLGDRRQRFSVNRQRLRPAAWSAVIDRRASATEFGVTVLIAVSPEKCGDPLHPVSRPRGTTSPEAWCRAISARARVRGGGQMASRIPAVVRNGCLRVGGRPYPGLGRPGGAARPSRWSEPIAGPHITSDQTSACPALGAWRRESTKRISQSSRHASGGRPAQRAFSLCSGGARGCRLTLLAASGPPGGGASHIRLLALAPRAS